MQKNISIFSKNCRNFQMFCTKSSYSAEFLKEFTESKKREKNVFPIIKERQKK